MNFIAIDFETADETRHSPCELGLTIVENGKIKQSLAWLIKPSCYPNFNPFNVSIHGIKAQAVRNTGSFPEVWEEVAPLVDGKFLIAHNASFDFSVLRNTLDYYRIEYPTIEYACSYILSKKAWTFFASYALNSLCQEHDIIFDHHSAKDDSRAAAEIFLRAIEQLDIQSLEQLKEFVRIGKLYPGGYVGCHSARESSTIRKDVSHFVPSGSNFNEESIFYGKTVVFTGKLDSMERSDAHQKIVDLGGILSKSVKARVDFLIVGQQEYGVVGADGLSSKQEKAIKMAKKGIAIEVISEDEFLRNI